MTIFKKEFDYSIWFVIGSITILLSIGLINMKNTDFYAGTSFHHSQILWLILGLIFASIVVSIDLRFFSQLADIFYWIIIFLLILVLIVGKEVNGAKRWLVFFGLNFQPSEFAKIITILMVAKFFHKEKKAEISNLMGLLKPMGYIFLPAVLVFVQPDLGTAIHIILINFSIIFFEGIKFRSFLILLGILFLIFPFSWKSGIIQEYQKDRIIMWISPQKYKWDVMEEKKIDRSMQPEQSLWAIGSGNILGKGGRNGTQSRLKFLPEIHTDFILSTYSEERGFLGIIVLFILFYSLIFFSLKIATKAKDKFGVLVGIGVTFLIFWKFFINSAMITGLLPVVGVGLPFLSYGGSSIITMMIGIGFITNIALNKGKVGEE